MRTVRFSGHLYRGGVCPERGVSRVVSAWGGLCPRVVCVHVCVCVCVCVQEVSSQAAVYPLDPEANTPWTKRQTPPWPLHAGIHPPCGQNS